MMSDWKQRLGMVYSTNPDYQFDTGEDEEPATLAPAQQQLRVSIEKKGRGGKVVTVIKGFVGREEDLRKTEKMLKTKCGIGGSSKDGEILLQGNVREKVVTILKDCGYSHTK